MRSWILAVGSTLCVLVVSGSGLMSPSSAGAESGFHCPGTPGSSGQAFAYMNGVTGQSSPSKALVEFLRTGHDGLPRLLSQWRHVSTNLFEYSGVRGNIRVTTYRIPTGSYVVTQVQQTCSTL
jgi:hypothetical protein